VLDAFLSCLCRSALVLFWFGHVNLTPMPVGSTELAQNVHLELTLCLVSYTARNVRCRVLQFLGTWLTIIPF
jgi:hypothetical protein